MNIATLFHQRLRGEGAGHLDIVEHLPLLHLLASRCSHVTEFGTRTGNSTVALLAGLDSTGRHGLALHSYDVDPPQFGPPPLRSGLEWTFRRADTSRLSDIAATDLLFIDTLHTFDQVEAELRHAARVRRYLAFHDTVLNGDHGEHGSEGIARAIAEFRATHPEWTELCHMRNCNGLLVLEKSP